MCNECGGQITLISYKWNNDENTMTYVYRCEKCGDLKEFNFEIKNEMLKDLIDNSELYNKYNL
jgi:hypothetical protein